MPWPWPTVREAHSGEPQPIQWSNPVRGPEAGAAQTGGNGGLRQADLEVDFAGTDAAVSALLQELVTRGLPVLRADLPPRE